MDRSQLVAAARELLGTKYENGVTVRTAIDLPESIDCSGAMAWVCMKFFDGDGRLTASRSNTTTAWAMFEYLQRPAGEPLPGDFVFYARTLDQPVGHVMMVTENGVIGACDVADRVAEYSTVQYSSRWMFRGYRAFPL